MAQESPSDPNTGGTGVKNNTGDVIAPSFVGGQTDPNTGIIVPSNANNASNAPAKPPPTQTQEIPVDQGGPKIPNLGNPPPAVPTTQLAAVNASAQPSTAPTAPSLSSELGGFAPSAGAALGSAIANPAVASALGIGGLTTPITSAINSGISATSGAVGAGAGVGAGSIDSFTTDAAVNSLNSGSVASGASGGALSGILGDVLPGVGAFGASLLTGHNVGTAAESGVGAGVGAALGSIFGPLGTAVGGALGSILGPDVIQPAANFVSNDIIKPVGNFFENDVFKPVSNFFSHLF